jgi:hypothetical protein
MDFARPIMWNVPLWAEIVLYLLIPVVVIAFGACAVWRIKKWSLGQAEPGTPTVREQLLQTLRPRRLSEFIRTTFFQSRLAPDPGDCHCVEQNYKTIRRHAMLQYFLEQMEIEPARLRLVWASVAEGQHLAESIDLFVADMRKLGPLNWPANWEENGQRLAALEDIVSEHAEAMEVDI